MAPTVITGNQQSRAAGATAERNVSVTTWEGILPATKLLIGFMALVIGVILALVGLDFWWTVLLGVGLYWGGGKFSAATEKSDYQEVIWVWPQIMRYTGATILVVGAFFNSGFGLAVKNTVNELEAAIACAAGEQSDRCQKRAAADANETAAEQAARLQAAQQQAAVRAAAMPAPVATGLGSEAYLAKIMGVFTPIVIADGAVIGPIGNFTGTCLEHTVVEGNSQHFVFLSRPDTTSDAVLAKTKGAAVIQKGHPGGAAHVFYGASGGEITVALERKPAGTC